MGSRIPEAPLCCALRTNRGLAFWLGGAVSLPRLREVRNSPELSTFQMKVCIGDLFLEVHAGIPYMLAQAESALLRSVNQARLGILAGGRTVWGLSFSGSKSIKRLARRAWTRGFLRFRSAAFCEPSEAWHSGEEA